MLEGEIRVVNPLGLHARAAAQLVRVSGRFKSRLILKRANSAADAKSMLEVLTLAASVNSVLELTADGEDEDEAFESIRQLFASGFGEI
jgi:phosphocarrier protein HPr